MNEPQEDHWLARPKTIRRIWQISIAILVATVALQFGIKIKGYFGVDEWLGFAAAFGFASCLVMVLIAKALGVVLKRAEDYYLKDTADD